MIWNKKINQLNPKPMALRWDCVCCLSCDATGKAGRGSRVGGGGLSSRCFIAHLAFYSLELTTDLHLTLAVPVSVSLYVYVFVCVCMCLPVRVFICVSVLLILAVCVCMCLCTRSGGMHGCLRRSQSLGSVQGKGLGSVQGVEDPLRSLVSLSLSTHDVPTASSIIQPEKLCTPLTVEAQQRSTHYNMTCVCLSVWVWVWVCVCGCFGCLSISLRVCGYVCEFVIL